MMHGTDSVKTYVASGTDSVNLQPDTDEVLQAEPEYSVSTIPVCVEEIKGPVRTQALPRKGGSTFTKTLNATSAIRVLTADHYRAKATLMCTTQDILVAFSETSSQSDSSMAYWPTGVPLPLECTTEVWVKASTGTPNLTVITERWAEGK